jgi:hypothetical protein
MAVYFVDNYFLCLVAIHQANNQNGSGKQHQNTSQYGGNFK